MKKHLNKKTKCIRNLKSFNIKNEDLYDLSLIKKIKDKIYKCDAIKFSQKLLIYLDIKKWLIVNIKS